MTTEAPHTMRAYASAADLERTIAAAGDPLSVATLVEADEQERFPHDGLAVVRDWGFGDQLVPAHLGGRLESYEQVFATFRALSRRDARLGVYYGTTLLAANPVWLWGQPQQQRWLADTVRSGSCGTFAASEDSGSDAANIAVSAHSDGDHLIINGTKWPVGNGHRSSFVTLYARTGPRGFSLLLLDKELLPAGTWRPVDAVPTLGLRGHDLSGIQFTDCPVPASVLLGREGSGVAMVAKTLQLTRTLIAGLAMGSLDSALRITLRYARGRELYGAPIAEIPAVRAVLVDAYLDLIVGECMAIPVTRAITAAPSRLSLWSSAVKYLVPLMCEEAVASLATVLSARRYLRTELRFRHFQKLERDLAIAGIFEGTTHVNLALIAAQLPQVIGGRPDHGDGGEDLLAHLFARGAEPLTWQPNGSSLRVATGVDEVTADWPNCTARALDLMETVDATLHAELAASIDQLNGVRNRLVHNATGPVDARSRRSFVDTRALTIARTHALLHAAASVLLTWLHSRGALPAQLRDGEWAVLCLDRIVRRLHTDHPRNERLMSFGFDLLCQQEQRGELFSLTPMAVAD